MIQEMNGVKELSIFWSFKVDSNLPKFKKKESQSNNSFVIAGGSFDGDMMGGNAEYTYTTHKNIFKRFITWLYTVFVLKRKERRSFCN